LSGQGGFDKIPSMADISNNQYWVLDTRKLIAATITLILISFALSEPSDISTEPNLADMQPKESKAALIICTGMIDDGLYKSIQRRTETALEEGASYVIYEIGTYGGLLQSMDDIAKYFIHDVSKRARTVAYIKTEAISAGALISVSCQDIIMRENTTIGDCAPISIGGKLEGVEREKIESFTRAAFDRAAEVNGYPKALLRAMVTMQLEVWRVKNIETGKFDFFENDRLPKDANEWDLADKELVVSDDEILTLTAKKAQEYGIARAVVADVNEALAFLEKRDNVKFAGPVTVFETNWSEEMVRLINSPAVMSILVLLALLGVYVELTTPGIGLPGLVAVICFTIIIGSKYLTGLANWVEIAVFVVGIILLLIEFFVLPGFGIAGVLGIIFIMAGLVGMLVRNSPDEWPIPRGDFEWHLFMEGVLGLLIGFVLFIVIAWLITKHLPKVGAFTGLALLPPASKKGDEFEASLTVSPEGVGQKLKVGDRGVVVAKLRPAGRAKFGEAIVDVVCEGDFLDIDTAVEILEIRGNRVVVRAIKAE
jgi:membrane-bound serine protease (ClpP class)